MIAWQEVAALYLISGMFVAAWVIELCVRTPKFQNTIARQRETHHVASLWLGTLFAITTFVAFWPFVLVLAAFAAMSDRNA